MKLFVAISGHGYGHLAQTAPVLQALHAMAPDVQLVVQSALPRALLAGRLAMPFEHIPEATDCNLVMRDAVRVDVPASLAAYRAFHDGWPGKVDAWARRLEALRVDAVFSNVGYLPLAAAQRAGLPAMAMCSLNWADIFAHYLGGEAGAGPLLEIMGAAYAGARAFLRPTPAMPMGNLGNAVAMPPVAQAGRAQRTALRSRLGLAADQRLVLIGMGGIAYRPPVEDWRRLPGVVYLVPDAWQPRHPAMRTVADAGMSFGDVLASVDALVTKPGYGSYVEAAVAGVPVLTIPREDWPEAPWLNDWLGREARRLEIPEAVLLAGNLAEPLAALWSLPAKPPVRADGAAEAARHVLTLLA